VSDVSSDFSSQRQVRQSAAKAAAQKVVHHPSLESG
jgi:hypothetical protein